VREPMIQFTMLECGGGRELVANEYF